MRYVGLLVSLFAAVMMAACSHDDGPSVAEPVNVYGVDGVQSVFASVAAETDIEGYIHIAASPRASLASLSEICAVDEYMLISLSPLLLDKQIDLRTERLPFTIESQLRGAGIELLAPGYTSEVRSAVAKVSYDGDAGRLSAMFEATLASGVVLDATIEVMCNLDVNTSSMARGSEIKPVRAAFYDAQPATTTIYLTPAGIDYAEELNKVSYYMALTVDNAMLTWQNCRLEDIGAESAFALLVRDNYAEENVVDISASQKRGASGTFTISRLGEGSYSLAMSIEVGGVSYAAMFSGECISTAVKKPLPDASNRITYGGEQQPLLSARLEKSEPWLVELTAESGAKVEITAPASFFDGNARGFSQSPDLTVSYNDRTYSKANGDSGTLTVLLDERYGTLSVEFTNYKDLSLYYAGDVTIVE